MPVESNYQRLETSNATVSDIMDTKQVQNLPLNGRISPGSLELNKLADSRIINLFPRCAMLHSAQRTYRMLNCGIPTSLSSSDPAPSVPVVPLRDLCGYC